MSIGLALVFGILYWFATNKLWYGTLHLIRQPIVLAVPIGLLGVLIDNLKRTYHSYFIHLADKAVEENNLKKMRRAEFWYPLIVSVPLRVVPAALALAFGVDAVTAFLNSIPAWATNGLSVAGGLLPALGFAVTIMVIGKKKLLPYFIIGFAIVAYSGINTIGVAVFAICIALLQGNFVQSDETDRALSFADGEEGDF